MKICETRLSSTQSWTEKEIVEKIDAAEEFHSSSSLEEKLEKIVQEVLHLSSQYH